MMLAIRAWQAPAQFRQNVPALQGIGGYFCEIFGHNADIHPFRYRSPTRYEDLDVQ